MKRVFDIVLILLTAWLWLPLMVVTALLVLCVMGWPVFFVQERPGLKGQPFKMLKFRTMRLGEESDKDRLTGFGRFLRATSLDEIPELLNVLKGEMSLVGPRPLLMRYLPRYSEKQMHRHDVLPGITGWAQVNGRNTVSWEEKFELDLWYVKNHSVWVDMKILFMTMLKVVKREGISGDGNATMGEFMGIIILCVSLGFSAFGVDLSISIDATKTNHVLQDTLYGAFFEDINYGADGGLYAELIENRSFEYYPISNGVLDTQKRGLLLEPLFPWEKIERDGSLCTLAVESDVPLNSNNTNYVKVVISAGGGAAGLCNLGYEGIPVVSGECYRVSFYARYEGASAPTLVAAVRGVSGSLIVQDSYSGITSNWTKFESIVQVNETDMDASFEITTAGEGTLYLDMISLFPCSTFNGRENGLRKDLAQAIADLEPATFRFPGGCITHGNGLDNAYRWKDSIGCVEERKPNWNRWGYHQTYGLGFYEYFLFCEDIGAEPIPIVPVGVSCAFQDAEYVPMDELTNWVQDVVDLIEFANGSVDSVWGAKRTAMGHPEPFSLKYIGLGNEEPATDGFRERFPYFVDAVRTNYPDIKIIGTSGWWSTTPNYEFMCEQQVDISDEHYYQSPEWFIQNMDRFDSFDRSKPKIYVGEYASGFVVPANELYNALSEACYLTGVERNADMVYMTAYAPLFARYGFNQWLANMVWFDEECLVKTPNYYVQQLFSLHKGDFTLPYSVENYSSVEDIGVAASIDTSSDEVILKLVNPYDHDLDVELNLECGDRVVASTASLIVLAGDGDAENTRDAPDNIVPQFETIPAASCFQYHVLPYSFVILRLKLQAFSGPVSYQEWIDGQPVPLESQGEFDSPAQDGIPNFLKYACGLPAMISADTSDFMDITGDTSCWFSVTYYKSKAAVNLSLEPVWSESLAGPWDTNGLVRVYVDENMCREKWKASVLKTGKGFMKLRATSLP